MLSADWTALIGHHWSEQRVDHRLAAGTWPRRSGRMTSRSVIARANKSLHPARPRRSGAARSLDEECVHCDSSRRAVAHMTVLSTGRVSRSASARTFESACLSTRCTPYATATATASSAGATTAERCGVVSAQCTRTQTARSLPLSCASCRDVSSCDVRWCGSGVGRVRRASLQDRSRRSRGPL